MKNVFLCPECGQEAEVCCTPFFRFVTRLDLPYFVCVKCCAIYYDKPLIGRCVSDLRKNDIFAKRVPHRTIYQKAKEILNEIVEYEVERMGYRYVRFKKKEIGK